MLTNVDWSIVASAIVKAAQAVLAALVLTGVFSLSGEQLGAIILAIEAAIGVPLSILSAARTIPDKRIPPPVPNP